MNPPKKTADPVPPPVGVGTHITDKPPSGELPVHATDPTTNSDKTPTGASQAARGQNGTMTTGRPAADQTDHQTDDRSTDEPTAARSTGSTTGTGSRAGSATGGHAPSTGLADGMPQGSSQGLSGAQGSGGGADQPALQPRSTRS